MNKCIRLLLLLIKFEIFWIEVILLFEILIVVILKSGFFNIISIPLFSRLLLFKLSEIKLGFLEIKLEMSFATSFVKLLF